MVYFAEIDKDNKVIQILVVPFIEEYRGEQYLSSDLLLGGKWVQCDNLNYPSIDAIYDQKLNIFIPPKPDYSCFYNKYTNTWELTEENKI